MHFSPGKRFEKQLRVDTAFYRVTLLDFRVYTRELQPKRTIYEVGERFGS